MIRFGEEKSPGAKSYLPWIAKCKFTGLHDKWNQWRFYIGSKPIICIRVLKESTTPQQAKEGIDK
jgi:hypothetical protein